ncbi:MAG: LOG family protein [Oligoflexia bacterium]|nr:LOG family protein [Oligoflexia bacterium]MBF0367592.1 LOG family protein [Oligoflexia bacterium]
MDALKLPRFPMLIVLLIALLGATIPVTTKAAKAELDIHTINRDISQLGNIESCADNKQQEISDIKTSEAINPMEQQELQERKQKLFSDIDKLYSFLKHLPAAVSCFGGSRLQAEDSYYPLIEKINQGLAEKHGRPRVGGRGGVMSFVADSFIKARDLQLQHARTQSVDLDRWYSPHTSLDHYIDVQLMPIRKFGLIANTTGQLCFAGGFGTMDEIFEIWNRSMQGRNSAKMAAVGKEFWEPIYKSLEQVSVRERPLITLSEWQAMQEHLPILDNPQEILGRLPTSTLPVFEEAADPETLAQNLKNDFEQGYQAIMHGPKVVTFLAGKRLSKEDPSCQLASQLAMHLLNKNTPLRINGAPGLAAALSEAITLSGKHSTPLKAIIDPEMENELSKIDHLKTLYATKESLVRNELLTQHTQAVVVLPGDLDSLNTLFSFIDQLQLNLLTPPPKLILVGKEYWTPLFDALKNSMLSEKRQLSSMQNFNSLQIVDRVEDAISIISQ